MDKQVLKYKTISEITPEEAIKQGKQIAKDLHKTTFDRYRELGQLVLRSGYEKGKWHQIHREKACKEWSIKKATFYHMLKLGTMTEKEFSNAVRKFASIHEWVNQINSPHKEDQIAFLRRQYRVHFIRNFASQVKHIENMLRDENPYLKKKEDLEALYQAVMRYGKKPFTAFVEDYWMIKGKLSLPNLLKGMFAVFIEQEYETKIEREAKTPELLAWSILKQFGEEKKIVHQDVVDYWKHFFEKEWNIDQRDSVFKQN